MSSFHAQNPESQATGGRLPSYEAMIIETLEVLNMPQGARPKAIYDYMMEHWPLIPNFRPSASQALQRALKRGRLLKNGALYSLNPDWSEEGTTTAVAPRSTTKYPASVLATRPPPLEEAYTPRETNVNVVHVPKPGERCIPPDTRATVQAAASLLRTISIPIRDLVDDQPTPSVSSSLSNRGSSWSDNSARLERRTAPNRFHMVDRVQSSESEEEISTRSRTDVRSRDIAEERQIRKSLLESLQTIALQLEKQRRDEETH
ncbi:hypothetical protein FRC17_008531 [Serendipita sp. 399]|nr:hypothetical protein FRC17_008531 [Serendipita sp. 399]